MSSITTVKHNSYKELFDRTWSLRNRRKWTRKCGRCLGKGTITGFSKLRMVATRNLPNKGPTWVGDNEKGLRWPGHFFPTVRFTSLMRRKETSTWRVRRQSWHSWSTIDNRDIHRERGSLRRIHIPDSLADILRDAISSHGPVITLGWHWDLILPKRRLMWHSSWGLAISYASDTAISF